MTCLVEQRARAEALLSADAALSSVRPLHRCMLSTPNFQPLETIEHLIWDPRNGQGLIFLSLAPRAVGHELIDANAEEEQKHRICCVRSRHVTLMGANDRKAKTEAWTKWCSTSCLLAELETTKCVRKASETLHELFYRSTPRKKI